jgi:hypothetical protein
MVVDSRFVLTLVTALGCGLIAGVFFAFSAFIMKALSRLQPAQGIAAMQSINIAVINPLFLGVFLGAGVACVAVAISSLLAWHQPGSAYLLAGSLLYTVGAFRDDGVQRAAEQRAGGRRSGERRGCQSLGGLRDSLDSLEPRADGRGPCGSDVAHHCALSATPRGSGLIVYKVGTSRIDPFVNRRVRREPRGSARLGRS